MKLHNLMLVCAAIALFATGCEEKAVMPGDNDQNQTEKYVAPEKADPEGVPADVLEDAINVTKALEICSALESEAVTEDTYKVKGWICSADASKNAEAVTSYGNVYFYLGINPESRAKDALYCYQCMGLGGKRIFSAEGVQPGDFVVVQCHMTNYKGTMETTGKGDAMILYSNNPKISAAPETTAITCAEARQIVDALSDNASSGEFYSITGYITNNPFSDLKDGNQTFWMDDVAGTEQTIEAYGYASPTGQMVPVGTRVRVWGVLTHYVNKNNGNYVPEIQNGEMEILSE